MRGLIHNEGKEAIVNERSGRSAAVRALGFLALCGILFLFPRVAHGQDTSEPPQGWQESLVGSINLSQTSFSNWSQGGEDFIAWTFGATGGLNREDDRSAWKNSLKLEYGLVKQGSEDARKAVDQIFMESVYTRKFGWKADPYLAANLRTQFAEGKNYEVDPPVVTSDFWDPAYLTQSAGLERHFRPELTSRLGLALQEVLTSDYRQYSDDPATSKIEKTKVEGGLESVTNYEGTLREGLVAKSKLALFYSFKRTDQLDVDWNTDLSLKVIKNISVNYNLQIIYDKDVIDKAQVKQFLGVGVSIAFI